MYIVHYILHRYISSYRIFKKLAVKFSLLENYFTKPWHSYTNEGMNTYTPHYYINSISKEIFIAYNYTMPIEIDALLL